MSTNRPEQPEPDPNDGRGLIGTTILGRYALQRVLGVGGKGTVYEASDLTMKRTVAVKVPTAPTEDQVKRFLREGRAGASVAHANVCAIYDFGALPDGTPFLVMERLDGETLGDRLEQEHRLALAEGIRIVLQVLAALGAAHAQGIVHRDVKPGNVLLARLSGEGEEVVKLLDFGASTLDPDHAKKEDDFEALTKIGTAIGTPTYMAPEQVRGLRDLDARVDIYAAGVVFYEAITGQRPFDAEKRTELFRAILRGDYRQPCAVEPTLPTNVDALVGRALATKREDRYPTAAAFANALESLRRETLKLTIHTPVVLGPPSTERLAPLKQRFEEVSSIFLSAESSNRIRLSRKSATSVEIPIFEEEEEEVPSTRRDGGFPFDDEDGPTRKGQ